MPIGYRIDTIQRLVLTRATGVLTDDEVIAHKQLLLRDPQFVSGMVELSDVRFVDRLDVTPRGVQAMSAHDEANSPQLQGYKLAIVASADVVFGMARMYSALTERSAQVNVFRDIDEARAWLGV